MMKQNELVPKRRFKRFNDEWKVNSFNDLLDELEGIRRGPFGSALKKEYFIPHSNYVVYEQQNAIYDKYQTRYYITKQKYEELSRFSINENDFIMSGAGTIGRISKVPKGIKKGVINQALIRIRVNKKIVDLNYFLQWMRSEDMQNKLTLANPASAMVNLVPMSEVKGWQIKVPSIEEQKKIGEFFQHFDEMIALQQRKLDKTKSLKSAYLAEMFPAEGESVPKRRFSGFTEEWRSSKLENIINMHNNLRVPVTASKRITGDIPYYGANGIQDYVKGSTHDGEFVLIAEDGANDLTDYPVLYVNGEVWINNHAHVVTGKMNILDNLFLVSRMKSMDISKWLVGGGRAKLNAEVLKNIQIKIPDFKEQIKIGEFFKKIDGTILIHQQKLEKLKATKQAYLHEMFV